jgi:diacylglycerol kinase family enzyme
VQRTDVERVEITAHAPFPWQVDGDYLGEVDRLSVAYEPDRLTLVVP